MENLQKEFVPYELALKMKQLGFDEPCLAIYDNITDENDKDDSDRFFYIRTEGWSKELFDKVTPVPLFSQCLRWFREKYQIEGFVHKSIEGNYYFVIKRTGNNENNMYEFTKTAPKIFDTCENAEVECLEKLIEIVKEKQK
jgi:hypothetical protein